MSKEFLRIGNHRKICGVYSTILLPDELAKIEAEVSKQTRLMYELGLVHYDFTKNLPKKQWRQRVSRLYYAAYNGSKAVRFFHDGNHSTDSKDHSKVGALPDNFPDRAKYENQLQSLREDRNSSDYDHLAKIDDLIFSPKYYSDLVIDFLRHAHEHLVARGLTLGDKP
jgi:hypothetical protein